MLAEARYSRFNKLFNKHSKIELAKAEKKNKPKQLYISLFKTCDGAANNCFHLKPHEYLKGISFFDGCSSKYHKCVPYIKEKGECEMKGDSKIWSVTEEEKSKTYIIVYIDTVKGAGVSVCSNTDIAKSGILRLRKDGCVNIRLYEAQEILFTVKCEVEINNV